MALKRVLGFERHGDGYRPVTAAPPDFAWIDKPVEVRGEDFTYRARCLCSFPKTNGKVRFVVEDNGRIFVQREDQLTWLGEVEP
jgi:hypothetical protein